MPETLYVIIGVVVLIVIFVIVQSIKKSAYSKAVYSEVEKLEQGKQLTAGGIAKGHAVLRMRLKLMPPEGLTRTLQNLS